MRFLAAAVKYVRLIEELVGAQIAMVTTSPERDDMILMRDPFRGLALEAINPVVGRYA